LIALLIAALWAGFALSWLAASFWSSSTAKRVGLRSELFYRAILIAGGIIFFIPAHGYEGPLRLWYVTRNEARAGVVLIALGFAFCWWARIALGDLWSGQVTIKSDHRVVERGPYALVRHPIYTGILLATLATAAVKGTVLGFLGAALIIAGLVLKARLEEHWLRQELGEEAYGAYSRRVPMLVPFFPV
jgi:protein-S-isoprenylcysteine O-methyltransferase Ste14